MMYTRYLQVTIYVLTLIILSSCDVNNANSSHLPATIEPTSYKQIQHFFDRVNYRWDTLDQGVPDITMQSFPADMGLIHDVRQKKQLFFLSLLPMVLTENKLVAQQRQQLLQLLQQYDRRQQITPAQQRWLQQLGKRYKYSDDPLTDTDNRNQLLSRVDTIPAALVLAQAANESAYGTSRFSQQANNIFGQWTFTPGTGLIPKDRPAGATYEVRKFPTLSVSIRSYLNNLNTHSAYADLRVQRQQMRRDNRPINADTLAEGLLNYSTRRTAYVAEIQTMISYNRLTQLSALELRDNLDQVAQHVMLPATQLSSRRGMTHNGKL